MKIIFIALLGLFLITCLHQANQLTGDSPKRFIVGLILMFVGGVSLTLCAAYNLLTNIDFVTLSLILVGDMLWMASERRTKKVARP